MTTAVSSRGLGHSPLKAGTRVRIPLPLLKVLLQGMQDVHSGSIVYRLGHDPFKVERRVRFPLELSAPFGAGTCSCLRRCDTLFGGVAQFG